MARDLGSLTAEDFRPYLGARFGVPDARIEWGLIEVTDLDDAGAIGSRRPFSLLFRGPRGSVLPQGIHRLEHDDLGEFDVFLVPIGPDEVGMRYEAVFG